MTKHRVNASEPLITADLLHDYRMRLAYFPLGIFKNKQLEETMANAPYFEFTLGRISEHIQYRIRVYAPQPEGPIMRLGAQDKANEEHFEELLCDLKTEHIRRHPNPTVTLVETKNKSCRIDSQPANFKVRNIHYQVGKLSFAVVTVDHGGEHCFIIPSYAEKLLKYIKHGLRKSFETTLMYNIRVELVKRDTPRAPFVPIPRKEAPGFQIDEKIRARIEKKIVQNRAKQLEFLKNTNKIKKGTNMIEHVAIAIERRLPGIFGTKAALTVGKKIPLLSGILGVFCAIERGWNGDYAGAIREVISGMVAGVPIVGTGLTLVLY